MGIELTDIPTLSCSSIISALFIESSCSFRIWSGTTYDRVSLNMIRMSTTRPIVAEQSANTCCGVQYLLQSIVLRLTRRASGTSSTSRSIELRSCDRNLSSVLLSMLNNITECSNSKEEHNQNKPKYYYWPNCHNPLFINHVQSYIVSPTIPFIPFPILYRK